MDSDMGEEEVDDSDMDKDYVDADGDHESSSDEEPVASSSKPPAKRSRPTACPQPAARPGASRAAATTNGREVFMTRRPRGEVLVFIDPPVEKADGDTDFDSGKCYSIVHRIFRT